MKIVVRSVNEVFNLDLHVAVIADLKQIFTELGHEVTDWSISAHTWVFGRQRDRVDVVNEHTWKQINRAMCDTFYERYQHELSVYDGFIVTHTPCFAMLYERWNKPVICVASTRYEHPFSDRKEEWEDFNRYLAEKIDDGLLIPVANNKYDADYAELFTGRRWQVIPSLCEYTGARYTGKLPMFLSYTKSDVMPSLPNVLGKRSLSQPTLMSRVLKKFGRRTRSSGYSWQELADFSGVIHLPYNASVMSIFEMYASGIPMFFPTLEFASALYPKYRERGFFSELSFNQVRGLPSRSLVPCGSFDPNDYENAEVMMRWIAKADFYDRENMKGLVYFSSFEELEHLFQTTDLQAVHEVVSAHQRTRAKAAYTAWQSVLATLSA